MYLRETAKSLLFHTSAGRSPLLQPATYCRLSPLRSHHWEISPAAPTSSLSRSRCLSPSAWRTCTCACAQDATHLAVPRVEIGQRTPGYLSTAACAQREVAVGYRDLDTGTWGSWLSRSVDPFNFLLKTWWIYRLFPLFPLYCTPHSSRDLSQFPLRWRPPYRMIQA